jgi:hypothetical protein
VLWIARLGPFGDRQYKRIAVLLNFEESCPVLLPLLGRRRRTSRPKSFEKFIHLGPRQINRVGGVRGGIEILYMMITPSRWVIRRSRDRAGAPLEPARHQIRVTAAPKPPRSGRWDAAQHHQSDDPPDGVFSRKRILS